MDDEEINSREHFGDFDKFNFFDDKHKIFNDDEDDPNKSTGLITLNSNNLIDSSNQNNQNLSNDVDIEEKFKKNDEQNEKKIKFNVIKSGIENNTKKNDRKIDDDNIRSKIKNNFLLFVIPFLNYLIFLAYRYQKVKFRKFKYKDIRNKEYIKNFLKKKFFEVILENKITSRFTTKAPELNKKYLKLFDLNDNSIVSNFLNMTMEFIYNNYFLNDASYSITCSDADIILPNYSRTYKTIIMKQEGYKINSFKLNGTLFKGDSFIMPANNVTITDVNKVASNINQKHKKKDEINTFYNFIEKLKENKEEEKYIEKINKIAKEDFISYYFNDKNKKFLSKKRKNN